MQNPDDYKDFQILGANLKAILAGFGSFTLLASKILLELGLGTIDAEGIGMAEIDPDKWYPLDRFVRAFDRISSEFGDYTLRQVGQNIPKNAAYPPSYRDLATALGTLDMGYHFNHGKNNQPMFNPQTGEMVEGIGHMATKPVAGKKLIVCEVDTPYPCSFDEGIVSGLAQRFEPTATVTHDPKSCRKKGAKSCIYNVTWK
jgi:hypothetical protein